MVPDKAEGVANFHRNTLHPLAELVAAADLTHPDELRPHHVLRCASSDQVLSFAPLQEQVEPGQLLAAPGSSPRFRANWALACSDTFARAS